MFPRRLSVHLHHRRFLATSSNSALASAATSPTQRTSKLGGRFTVTLIPGDGIGQEIAAAVKTVFRAASVPIDFEQYDVSGHTSQDSLPFRQAVASLRRTGVGLKGVIYTPLSSHTQRSFNVALRKELDMYAGVALCRNLDGLKTRHENVDICVIRENTEGEYAGLEHQTYPGVVESLKVITREKSERIARFAFDFAVRNHRKKVTCIHKANIMKMTDGLFLESFRKVARSEYADTGIEFNDMIVDNASMQLVSRPQQFDVVLTPNLYGNIVSNVAAALVGGPGLVPGVNLGREYALFEPGSRHVAKDIQGRNTANPTAMILSGVMMLRHLGLEECAQRIENAVYSTLKAGNAKTPDLGGSHTTTDFTLEVISYL